MAPPPETRHRILAGCALLGLIVPALLPLGFVYLAPLADAAERAAFAAGLTAPLRWSLAGRSLLLALSATLLAVCLGLPVGLAPRLRAGPGRTLWAGLALLPLALPPYLSAIAWIGLFGDHGLVRRAAAGLLGDLGPPSGSIYSLPGCAWVQALSLWPCVALLVRSGRLSLDPAAEEAARVHLPPLRAFVKVIVPAVRRELLLGAALVFVLSLADFSVPSILQVNVFALQVFEQFEKSYDHVASAAMSVPVLLAVAALLGSGSRLLAGPVRIERSAAPEPVVGAGRISAWVPLLVVLAISAGVPVLQLLLDAGGLDAVMRALQVAGRSLKNTALLGVLGMAVVGGAGLALALLVRLAAPRAETAITCALAVSFILPAALVGVGLVLAFNRPGPPGWVYGGPAILLVACYARFVVVPFRILSTGIDTEAPAWEAARVHGLRPATVLLRVLLPPLGEHLRAALLVVYVLALGELGSFVLVQPPGWDTVPIRLFQLIHYGYEREVAALALLLLGLVLLPVAGVWVVRLPRLRPGS